MPIGGYVLRATSVQEETSRYYRLCTVFLQHGVPEMEMACTAHNIEARDLFNAVLADINRFADMAVNDEKAVRAIEKRLTETDHSRAKALKKEQRKLKQTPCGTGQGLFSLTKIR